MNDSADNSGATGDLQTALQHTATLLQNDASAAAQQARLILTVFPGEPRAGVLLATAERRCGKLELAIQIVSTVVDQHPGNAIAWQELGMSLLAAGRWTEAEGALARTVAIDERHVDAWKALADIRAVLGEERGGGGAYQQHIKLSAGGVELIRVADALFAGKLGVAEDLCRKILKKGPRNVGAMRMLAEVAMHLDRLDDAENLLTLCLELEPEFHLARHDYANLLFIKQRPGQALAEIDKVTIAEPNRPAHLLFKASVLAQIGRTEDAIEIFDAVLQRCPDHFRTHLSRGHALRTVGRLADSVAAYRKAIALQPTCGEAYWSLANLKTFKFDATDIAEMQGQLEAGLSSQEDFWHLSFALGKALEDRQEFDESFRHYAGGNAAKRRSEHWDADKHHTGIERIKTFFHPEFFASRGESGNSSPAPIFIVGLPRAGSTLLEQILSSHSQVEGTMELPDIMSIARRLGAATTFAGESLYPEVLAKLTADDVATLGTEYLDRTIIHRTGAPFFIDKMPNNFVHIGLIHLILPNAKIIDARRHPMACCFAGFKQLFAHGQAFTYSLEEIGRYYRDYVELMTHWSSVLPARVLRVDYEAIVENTAAEVRRVLDYCGLDFEPACLEFYRTDRAIRTPSSEQVRQPIYESAVDQWRNYEAHLAPLSAALD
ncbi:MAG: sulfotransferase [Woeseia sp.]